MSSAPSFSFLLLVALSIHQWVSVVQCFSALPFSSSSSSRCSNTPYSRNENARLLFSSAWAPYLMDQHHLVQDEADAEGRQAAAAGMSISPEQQHGFAASWFESSTNGPPSPVMDVDVTNRYFQLEEMEDAERRMTGLWLLPDGSIGTEHASLQEVEGGLLQGHWYYRHPDDNEHDDDELELEMVLTRTFPAGRIAVRPSDMGEFEYSIQRIYRGRLTAVGEHVAIEGSIWVPANQVPGGGSGDSNMLQVGYFSMIDTQFQEYPPADIPLSSQESVAMPPPPQDDSMADAARMMPQDANAWDLQPAFVGGPIC